MLWAIFVYQFELEYKNTVSGKGKEGNISKLSEKHLGISISQKPFLSRITLYDTVGFKTNSNDFDAFCVNIASEKWRALYKVHFTRKMFLRL